MKNDSGSATRREFVQSAAAVAATALLSQSGHTQISTSAQPSERELAHDPRRPQFHLLPARNWMNDPNGPIWMADGKGGGAYHMFFQYNPLAAVWGNMSWNHAISPDMLHWTHLPLALTPTPNSPDSFGCFSGSAIKVGSRVYVVYTGTQKSDDAHATIRDGANNVQESQCLAWSDDAKLVRWTKDPQPIVPAPPSGMTITGFRDPSVWRQRDWYYMTVGSGVPKVGGCVLLYRSPATGDLRQWEYLHPLVSGEWNGTTTANPCDDGEMWECPEFFALGDPAGGGSHVLIYSTLGKVFWISGILDTAAMKFLPGKTGELDLGAFYAPKTQLDAHGRRILWGWIPEKRTEAEMKVAGWSGMMSLPRVMQLDADGTLRLTSLPETTTLRRGTLPVNHAGSTHTLFLAQASGEVVCSGAAGSAMRFTMHNGVTVLMDVSYVPERHAFVADGKAIMLQPGDRPMLHAYVDASVVELIVSERIGYTKRFYYEGSSAPDITVHASGADLLTLVGWKIAPISINRLTAPALNRL